MKISITSKPLHVNRCMYTITRTGHDIRCESCSTYQELLATPYNEQIATKYGPLLATPSSNKPSSNPCAFSRWHSLGILISCCLSRIALNSHPEHGSWWNIWAQSSEFGNHKLLVELKKITQICNNINIHYLTQT